MSSEFETHLSRARAGDRDATGALITLYESMLRSSLQGEWQKYQSFVSLDDVIQVTYEKAMLHLPRFAGETPHQWSAWLATIARNTLHDMYRALQREVELRAPQLDRVELQQLVNEVLAKDCLPPDRAASLEVAERLRAAVPMLPENYRAVIELELQGEAPAKIATTLGCSRAVVYARRKAAMDMLREILGHPSSYFTP